MTNKFEGIEGLTPLNLTIGVSSFDIEAGRESAIVTEVQGFVGSTALKEAK